MPSRSCSCIATRSGRTSARASDAAMAATARLAAAPVVLSLAGLLALPAAAADFENPARGRLRGPRFRRGRRALLQEEFRAERRHGRVPGRGRAHRQGGAAAVGQAALPDRPMTDCSERAEVWERTKLWVPYDQGIWYRFSVKFADPVPRRRPPLSDRPVEARDPARRRGRFQPVSGAAAEPRQALRHGRNQSARGQPPGSQGHRGRLRIRRGAGLAASRHQSDAGAGRYRRELRARRRHALQRLQRRSHRSPTAATSCRPPHRAGSTSSSTRSPVPTAPAISRFSPTTNGSSPSRAISGTAIRVSATTSTSSSDPIVPRAHGHGRSITTISAAVPAAPR